MTVLSSSNANQVFKRRMARRPDGPATAAMPIYATADTVYSGAILVKNRYTGLVAPAGAGGGTAGDYFVGFATQTRVYSASSSLYQPVEVEGGLGLSETVSGATTAAISTGKFVYGGASSDNETDYTLTRPANTHVAVGYVEQWISSGVCNVRFFTPEESLAFLTSGRGQYWHTISANYPLANLASSAAVIGEAVVLKGSGTIKTYRLVVNSATTDSNADGLFIAKIGSTAITGASITTGDTGDAAGVKAAPDGAAIDATCTALNQFDDGDTLTAYANYATNAYSDGAVALKVLIERD